MSLENASFIHQLDAANPSGSDRLATGDDHIRMLKAAIKATFPNVQGPVNLSHSFLNGLVNGALPPGSIMLFAGAAAPTGWAICDGGTYPKADGSGNVAVPDLRGRVALGADASHPLGQALGQTSKTVTSDAGGGHSHAGTTGIAGSHTHPVTLTGATGVADDPYGSQARLATAGSTGILGDTDNHTHPVTLTGNTGAGGDHAHSLTTEAVSGHSHSVTVDVTQPSLALNYIIKL